MNQAFPFTCKDFCPTIWWMYKILQSTFIQSHQEVDLLLFLVYRGSVTVKQTSAQKLVLAHTPAALDNKCWHELPNPQVSFVFPATTVSSMRTFPADDQKAGWRYCSQFGVGAPSCEPMRGEGEVDESQVPEITEAVATPAFPMPFDRPSESGVLVPWGIQLRVWMSDRLIRPSLTCQIRLRGARKLDTHTSMQPSPFI